MLTKKLAAVLSMEEGLEIIRAIIVDAEFQMFSTILHVSKTFRPKFQVGPGREIAVGVNYLTFQE